MFSVQYHSFMTSCSVCQNILDRYEEWHFVGDIFVVLHLCTMVKSKQCMHDGAGLKLDTSILKRKSSFHEFKIPSFWDNYSTPVSNGGFKGYYPKILLP